MFTPITKIIKTKEGRRVEVALFQKDGLPMCWVDKEGSAYFVRTDKRIAQFIDNAGYLHFRVKLIKTRPDVKAHRAVLTAWRGPCPPGYECDHINNVKTDNRLCNLRWLPRKQNQARRRKKVLYSYRIEIYDRANLTLRLTTNSVKVAVAFLSGDPNMSPQKQTHGVTLLHLPECTDHVIKTRNYQIVVTKKKRERRNNGND